MPPPLQSHDVLFNLPKPDGSKAKTSFPERKAFNASLCSFFLKKKSDTVIQFWLNSCHCFTHANLVSSSYYLQARCGFFFFFISIFFMVFKGRLKQSLPALVTTRITLTGYLMLKLANICFRFDFASWILNRLEKKRHFTTVKGSLCLRAHTHISCLWSHLVNLNTNTTLTCTQFYSRNYIHHLLSILWAFQEKKSPESRWPRPFISVRVCL